VPCGVIPVHLSVPSSMNSLVHDLVVVVSPQCNCTSSIPDIDTDTIALLNGLEGGRVEVLL
jgi:hypothetical protein